MAVCTELIRQTLTPRQARAVRLYARNRKQVVVARRLGITQQAVSRLLTDASANLTLHLGREVCVVELVRSGVTR